MYKVFCCGSNGSYQLGVGHDEDTSSLVAARFVDTEGCSVAIPSEPVQVACGGNHTLIVLANGDIYSAGDNTYGQCGHTGKSSIAEFTKIEGKWATAACGWEFSVLANLQGEIFCCGRGLKGELGLGRGITQTGLAQVASLGPVRHLRTSLNHTIVQLADNRLFGWGACRKGQLGLTRTVGTKREAAMWEPRELQFENLLPTSRTIYALGRDFTVFFTDTLVYYGAFAWSHRELQHPFDVADVKAMWSSVHVLSRTDTLAIESIGNGGHGQLNPYTGRDVRAYAIGSEHGLALTSDNRVYAWGWGEHGNCGTKESDVQDNTTEAVTYPPTQIYNKPHTITSIACGCATSWVIVKE